MQGGTRRKTIPSQDGRIITNLSSSSTSDRLSRGMGIARGTPPEGNSQTTRPGSSVSTAWYQSRSGSERREWRSKERRRRVMSELRWRCNTAGDGIDTITRSSKSCSKRVQGAAPIRAREPAVVQLQGIAVTDRQSAGPLEVKCLHPTVRVHGSPIGGLSGEIRSVRFGIR